jgi:glutaredoxin 3
MKAVVWSKSACPFCDRAVALLTKEGYEIEVKKVGEGYTREDLLEAVPGARSVPQIFIEDEYVGGYTELAQRIG